MNVSIKPFLILTSSPQMASLIYPFPRILAVHLKYAAANTSWKQTPNCQGHMGLLVFLCLVLLSGHIRLITCPLRWPDMIIITPQALSWKSLNMVQPLVWQPVFSPFFSASFWLQLEPAMRAEADAAVHRYHCRGGFSYLASSSKGIHCCWKGLMTCAKQEYVACCDL